MKVTFPWLFPVSAERNGSGRRFAAMHYFIVRDKLYFIVQAMKFILRILFPCLLLLTPRFAMAWSGPGHLLIAAEAYRQLTPELKAEAFHVLQWHPDFAKWTNAYHPNPSLDLAAYVFLRSSTWPDEIRHSDSIYDHPDWHFVDYPLRPPSFPFETDARTNDDVLFGIAQCEQTLCNTNAAPELRAVYLSYLIHLVGDIHQPLHCESFFNDAYPNGDRGGNDFYVKPDQNGVRLHEIWDGLLGSSSSPRAQWNDAIALGVKFPRSSLPVLLTDTTPKSWSLESRQLAISAGYLNGKLAGATNLETAPPLPAGYTKAAQAVAERQGALAGDRLADEIRTYLKCAGPIPPVPANTAIAANDLPKVIGAADASKYYDETMTVTGKVVQVTVRPNIIFLNIDEPFPHSPLEAVIFPANAGKFGDLQRFKGRDVEMNGTITEYHNKPEIILDSTDQLRVQ